MRSSFLLLGCWSGRTSQGLLLDEFRTSQVEQTAVTDESLGWSPDLPAAAFNFTLSVPASRFGMAEAGWCVKISSLPYLDLLIQGTLRPGQDDLVHIHISMSGISVPSNLIEGGGGCPSSHPTLAPAWSSAGPAGVHQACPPRISVVTWAQQHNYESCIQGLSQVAKQTQIIQMYNSSRMHKLKADHAINFQLTIIFSILAWQTTPPSSALAACPPRPWPPPRSQPSRRDPSTGSSTHRRTLQPSCGWC